MLHFIYYKNHFSGLQITVRVQPAVGVGFCSMDMRWKSQWCQYYRVIPQEDHEQLCLTFPVLVFPVGLVAFIP